MPWIELKIPCEEQTAENLSDLLFDLGALSVTFEDAQDNPIFEPEPGTMPLWEQTNVIALFSEDAELVPVYAKLQLDYPEAFSRHKIDRVEDQQWEKAYLDSFKPLKITDKLWICPSWHEPPAPDAINVILDPGVAFGTGNHETTQLCLSVLAKIDLTHKTVIDYGCGSGILGIAALKLGAKKVFAVDIHTQALEATMHNAKLNNLKNQLISCTPEELPTINADVIVANILADPLIQLSTSLIKLLNTKGQIILSGLLIEQISSVENAYSKLHDKHVTTQHEWACLTFSKR